ncbi:MAG TPA: uracil-DNA glycosylase [Gemmataceae bacterium]|nr:uracil-DNA glycosylase [Gemmataceae bacterium]
MDLAHQLKLHLEALKAAGIDFIPRMVPVAFTVAPNTGGLTPPARQEPATPAADSPEGRRRALGVLAEEAAACECCPQLFATRTQTVFGVGPIDPDVCFVGEAPGADEDAQGLPFVGRSGQLLTRIILACGFTREDVYICNTLKCRPPNNRTPTPDERTNCLPFFERQLSLVKPKHIVAVGATAAKNLLNTTTGINRLRGKVYEYMGVPLICTFHPSAVLRDISDGEPQKLRAACWDDMKLLLRTMGRPIPGSK